MNKPHADGESGDFVRTRKDTLTKDDLSDLTIAYEYDPYFGLSISRVDPQPHQLEAVSRPEAMRTRISWPWRKR